jgi:nucleoside-diphosphate-sugar epimerase
MKVVVTGATGSLGAYLTRWFSAKGHQVTAVGRTSNPPQALLACAAYVQTDISRSFKLPEAEACIHCAALADDKATWPQLFAANVGGTKNVLHAAAGYEKFVHISSSSVYQYSNASLVESMAGDATGRLSGYGRSKLLSEEAVMSQARSKSNYILRPRAIYGVGDKVLLPRLLKLLRGGRMLRPGDMHVQTSLTHFSNLAQAAERCLQDERTGHFIYNVADDDVYHLYDAARMLLLELCDHPLAERRIPLWLLRLMSVARVGDATPMFVNTVSKSLVLDTSRIRNELGYAPAINFYRSLPELKEWVRMIGGVEEVRRGDPQLAWRV